MKKNFTLLFLGFLGWTLNYIYRMMIPPILPIIVEELKLNSFEAGMLMSGFFMAYASIQLPAGFISDKFNRRNIIFICILFSSLSAIFTGMAITYSHLFLSRVLFGFAASIFYSPMISMLSDAFEPKFRGRAIGFFMSGSRLGSAIAPIIGVMVAVKFGWRAAFLITAFPGLILAVLFLIFTKEPKRGGSGLGSISQIKSAWRALILAYILPFLMLMGSMCFNTFLPLYLTSKKGLTIEEVALITFISSVAGFFGQVVGGLLNDKIGYKKTFILTLIIASLVIPLLHFSPKSVIIIPIAIFGFISVAGTAPIITYTVEFSPQEVRGLSLGIGNTTGFIGASLGSAVGGLIIDLLGYDFFILFIFIIYVCGCLLSFKMKTRG